MTEAQHTPGKVHVSDAPHPRARFIIYGVDSRMVADCGRTYRRTADEIAANADRFSATWNACEGISTEALEQGAVQNLLAVAEKVDEWERKYPATRIFSHGQTVKIAEEMSAIVAEARAASAKARGQA